MERINDHPLHRLRTLSTRLLPGRRWQFHAAELHSISDGIARKTKEIAHRNKSTRRSGENDVNRRCPLLSPCTTAASGASGHPDEEGRHRTSLVGACSDVRTRGTKCALCGRRENSLHFGLRGLRNITGKLRFPFRCARMSLLVMKCALGGGRRDG